MFSRAESADLSRVFGVKSSSFAWAGEALRKKVFAAEGRGIAQNRVRVAVRRTLVLSARAEGGWFPCPLPAGGVQDASHAPGVLRDRALDPPSVSITAHPGFALHQPTASALFLLAAGPLHALYSLLGNALSLFCDLFHLKCHLYREARPIPSLRWVPLFPARRHSLHLSRHSN